MDSFGGRIRDKLRESALSARAFIREKLAKEDKIVEENKNVRAFLEAGRRVNKIKMPEEYRPVFVEMMQDFARYFKEHPEITMDVEEVFTKSLFDTFNIIIGADYLESLGANGCYTRSENKIVVLNYDEQNKDFLKHSLTHEFVHYLINNAYGYKNGYKLWVNEAWTELTACAINGDPYQQVYSTGYDGIIRQAEIMKYYLEQEADGAQFDSIAFLNDKIYDFTRNLGLDNEAFDDIVLCAGGMINKAKTIYDRPVTEFNKALIKVKMDRFLQPIEDLSVSQIVDLAKLGYGAVYSFSIYRALYGEIYGEEPNTAYRHQAMDDCLLDIRGVYEDLVDAKRYEGSDEEIAELNAKFEEKLAKFRSIVKKEKEDIPKFVDYIKGHPTVSSKDKNLFFKQMGLAYNLILKQDVQIFKDNGHYHELQKRVEQIKQNKAFTINSKEQTKYYFEYPNALMGKLAELEEGESFVFSRMGNSAKEAYALAEFKRVDGELQVTILSDFERDEKSINRSNLNLIAEIQDGVYALQGKTADGLWLGGDLPNAVEVEPEKVSLGLEPEEASEQVSSALVDVAEDVIEEPEMVDASLEEEAEQGIEKE